MRHLFSIKKSKSRNTNSYATNYECKCHCLWYAAAIVVAAIVVVAVVVVAIFSKEKKS